MAEMGTGDTEPPWTVTVASTNPETDFNLAASWRFVAKLRDGPIVFTDTAPTVVVGADVNTATVSHAWALDETDNAGLLTGEVVVIWPGGREQTLGHETKLIVQTID